MVEKPRPSRPKHTPKSSGAPAMPSSLPPVIVIRRKGKAPAASSSQAQAVSSPPKSPGESAGPHPPQPAPLPEAQGKPSASSLSKARAAQSPSPSPGAHPEPLPPPPASSPRPQRQAPAATPSEAQVAPSPPKPSKKKEKALALMRLLMERWPAAFPQDPAAVKPLAIGIHREVIERLPESPPGQIRKAIILWLNPRKEAYLRALAAGGSRYDLEGRPKGEVSPEHREQTAKELAAWEAQ